MPPRKNICADCGSDIVLFEHECWCAFYKAEPALLVDPTECTVCGMKLVSVGVDNQLICPVHSTRGVPV